MVAGAKRLGKTLGIIAATEGVPVGPQEADGLVRRFIEELDPEFTKSGLEKMRKVGDSGLRAGVEDGVTATDVGPDGVGLADAVANGDAVTVAGAAAGEVVLAMREEGGEDAVFHMKHRDVLVEGEFKPLRWGRAEEFENLADIEVVAGGEGTKAFGNKEIGG